MSETAKRQKRQVGDVVRISLGEGFHTYARVLEEALFAFYDARTPNDLPIEKVWASPILFQVPVMNHGVKRG